MTSTAGSQTAFHKIRSLAVKGGFLDGMDLDFAESLNCLIGGRGTGKTSVLELVRWVLDHMPDEAAEHQRYRSIDRLIQANLGSGQVTAEIETLNGIRYRVRRGYGEPPLVLGDGGEPVEIDIGKGTMFSVEIYSQDQIEEIANDPLFQLKLIDKFVGEKIKEVNKQVQSCIRQLDANAVDILKLRRELMELKEQITELPEVTEKLKAFKIEEGGEEAKALQRESEFKALREQERLSFERLQQVFSDIEGQLHATASELHGRIGECFDEDILRGPNAQFFRDVRVRVDATVRELARKIEEAARSSESTRREIAPRQAELETVHLKQEKVYQDLLESFEKEKDKAKERDRLLRHQAQLQDAQKRLEKKIEELQKHENARRTLLHRLSDLKDDRYRVRAEVADMLTEHLGPTIRVRIEQNGNVDAYRNLVAESMKGSGVRYTQLVDKLVQRMPPQDFAAIIHRGDAEMLKDQVEIDIDRASRMVQQFRDTKAVFDVEVVELHDRPTIELKDGQDYKDASSLSTGQKCTTILPILLLESASPLLIDQPEDNLDNAFIYETVVKSLREVRERRQLIFVTHNPNIPVLGDAQRVFVLQSTGRQASVKAVGTVDEVKDEVETILEGGKEAFGERKKRYGY